MDSNLSKTFYGYDFYLAAFCILLSLFGLAAVYSSTRTFGTTTHVFVQLTAVLLGVFCMSALSFSRSTLFFRFRREIFFFYTGLLILVYLVGITGVWGSKSWIKIGGISIQPSEIAKPCFIITFSAHLSDVRKKINSPLVFAGLVLHAFVPVGLILMQPDFGTATVFVFMFLVMIFSAGLSLKIFLTSLGVCVPLIPFLYLSLSEYQKNRILTFLHPGSDPLGIGYNVKQSVTALGSGKLLGRGFLEGVFTQNGLLPAKHTDFIFSSICEEFGFLGGISVVLILAYIVLRCFYLGYKSTGFFERSLCIGTGSMLLFHSIENIGMCMGLLPVTGIPLPFVSYGGTSILSNFVCIGLVMSVSYHRQRNSIFEKNMEIG